MTRGIGRVALLVGAVGAAGAVMSALTVGCDKDGPLADLDAGWAISPSASPSASAAPEGSAAASAAASAAPPERHMPPRPVPTTSPTVRITMPMDVQLQAIQYMSAMEAPQPDDAPADPGYAATIASGLAALGKIDVVSSGRRIDIQMLKGCDAQLPRQAIARHTSASLTTLLSHGMLVVRCTDKEVQCLQSTRDVDDVLCTHK